MKKQKRADQLKVGDVTRDYGIISDIVITPSGDSVEIYGTIDRATVWKKALIELK